MLMIRGDQLEVLDTAFRNEQARRLLAHNVQHRHVVPPEKLTDDVLAAGREFGFESDDDLQRLSDLFAWFRKLPPGNEIWRAAAVAVLSDRRRPPAARLDFMTRYIQPRIEAKGEQNG